jgi:SNF2 family DNA or RNA helicase
LLTTYDKVRINYEQIRGDFYHDEEEGKMWNYVILDEAHFIKNPTAQRSRHLLEIPCVHRIAISGTLIQNNLKVLPSYNS